MQGHLRRMAGALPLAAALGLMNAPAWPQAPRLETNEAAMRELSQTTSLAIDDPMAVFAFVMAQLPERVRVYPTENYYYFSFLHGGVRYDGNIRLAADTRDKGLVNFAYGERLAEWHVDPPARFAVLGATQGVAVERLSRLLYRIAHAGRSVTFALNDLSQVKPPIGLLRAEERFIGPVFDESGIRFFLVFNTRLKLFHFLLDETVPVADGFVAAPAGDRIVIGKRTGFAFYRDGDRKVLIGVSAVQSQFNTALDGPFDQLPENFIEGETLRDAIVAGDPDAKGHIDRLGHYTGDASRYLIHPFLPYREVADLAVFHRCATARSVPAAERPGCFVVDPEEVGRRNPRPRALKRRR